VEGVVEEERAGVCFPTNRRQVEHLGGEIVQRLQRLRRAIHRVQRVHLPRPAAQTIERGRHHTPKDVEQTQVIFGRPIRRGKVRREDADALLFMHNRQTDE